MPRFDFPLIIIGAGAAGLVIAVGAAKAGKKVLLIEKGTYGGDCTNFGCIPSKSLIAAGKAAYSLRTCASFGIECSIGPIDAKGALKRTRDIVEKIKRTEDPIALERQHVTTLTGTASFQDPHTLKIVLNDGSTKSVTGKNIVITTGSHPAIPLIKGLNTIPYLTNETLFSLENIPSKLAIVGGGAIGCEMAQTFQRLGSEVSIIERSEHLLSDRAEPEAQKVLEHCFTNENIHIYLKSEIRELFVKDSQIVIDLKRPSGSEQIETTHLLIATGREANIQSLNLNVAGVKCHDHGIITDKYGRSTQKNIWAAGDVTGRAIFTHIAENEARSILTSLLMPWPFKKAIDTEQSIPRVTYTDPEVASMGLNESQALKMYGKNSIAVYFIPFSDIDRAITTGRTEGFVKVITKKWSSNILGATVVGPRAGEMLPEICLAKHNQLSLRKLAHLIHPYPTYSLAIRKAADQWLTKTILPSIFNWITKGKT